MEYSKKWLYPTLLIIATILFSACAQESSSHYFKNGSAKYNLKDFNGAIKDLNKAIELQKDNSEAYYVRANCYGELGEISKATNDFKTVLEINPDYKDVFVNRAYYIKTPNGDYEGAISDYNKFIELNTAGNNAFAFNNRGFAKYKLGQYRDALTDIDKSLQIAPDNSFAYKNKGLIFIALDSLATACDNLNRAAELGYTTKYDDEVQQLISEYCKE